MNLNLNFVNNYDYLNGRYNLALIGFKDVIKRVSNHAFAHYFSALCYEKLGEIENSKDSFKQFKKSVGSDSMWAEYAKKYNLL